jgi:uncharacterized membrane protein
MLFGYDWPRLHAALNDLPPALLLVAVLFEILGAINKRDTLRAAGFWCLVTGVAGTLLAIGSGLMAEDHVEHTDAAHALMERHETLAFVVLGVFGVMLLWRLIRRAMLPAERTAYLVLGVAGVVALSWTAKIGGSLVFDHALGLKAADMHEIIEARGSHVHHHGEGDEDEHAPAAMPGDSAKAMADSTAGTTHVHPDGTTHTH